MIKLIKLVQLIYYKAKQIGIRKKGEKYLKMFTLFNKISIILYIT